MPFISRINGAFISASYALTASYANFATSATNADTASLATRATTASLALNVSSSLNVPNTVSVLLQDQNFGAVYRGGTALLKYSDGVLSVGSGVTLFLDNCIILSSSTTLPASSPPTGTTLLISGSNNNWFLYTYVGNRWRSASLA